jgi:hypothetical protein
VHPPIAAWSLKPHAVALLQGAACDAMLDADPRPALGIRRKQQ